MAPSPTTPPQKSPGHNNDITPNRATSFLAAALLGRPINIQRRSSNDLEDRAAVSAELRREGAKAKRQTLDLGKPLGPYDTNSVRDRVRKWQAQGGGVITQPDLVYPPEVTPVVSEVGAKTGGGSDGEETDLEALRKRNRRERRKERIAAEKGQEDPEAGPVTPMKRVVSDGHWRKRPSPPRRVVSGKGKQPDRSLVALPDDGIRVRPMREVSERRRATADEKGMSKAPLGDDGIRVYVTERRGDDARKAPKVVVEEEDGIRVYSIKKGGGERRKASKTSIDGDGEGSRPVKQENDGKKASKAPIGGDGNRVRDIRGREEARREDSRRPIDDDGIRVYSTKRRVSAHRKPNMSTEDSKRSPRSKSDSQTEEDRPSPKNTPTASRNRRKSSEHADVALERSPKENRASPAEEKSRRRRSNRQKSRTPEHSPKPRESPTAGEHPKPKPKTQVAKTNVLKEIYDESKRALRSAKAAEPSPPVPGKRIEAWLSKTPDPLVEPPQNPDTIPPSEIGQPDMMSVIKEDDESDVHISASQSGRRRRDSPAVGNRDLPLEDVGPKSPAREVPDVVESSPQLVSPNLKRVGAKRESPSPTREKWKYSPVKKLPVQDENATSPTAGPKAEPSSPVINIESSEFAELPSTLKKRLSTIASVETLNVRSATPPAEPTQPVSEATFDGGETGRIKEEELHESEAGDTFDLEMPDIPGKKSNLKRRLTTHADLISVLSLPRGGSKSIRSARSIRTNRSRLATATIGDLLGELAADETKYMRELRTLVDGVIPVLLHCALSKSDSAVVAELFQRAAEPHKHDPNFTRPIIEMGIALERLKVLHKKIPAHDADEMLRWANGAREVYAQYLKAWRLGFQDVVVNLAPGNEGLAPDEQSVFKGLPRDENGDVVNGDGERVDVAFLLKRPLVRLKYLAKTFKGINFIKPSPNAEEQATRYQNLVIDARRRANEERARLEDEAAASIDATRARDPRTLGPLTGVSIDQTRRVRARDIFSMDLHHSSGQRMDCKVEMILRDDAPNRGGSGDVLICEVDGTGRWLLFPPVAFGRVSARNGSLKGEIVVMIRGYHGRGKEWQELLILHNVDEQVGFEWVQLLGLKPVPPEIIRRPSFVVKDQSSRGPSPSLVSSGGTQSHVKSRTPSPRGIEVPIGELARFTTKRLGIGEAESPIRECSLSKVEREDLDSAVSTAEADEMGRQHGIPVHPPSQDERSVSPASSYRATVETRTRYDHSPHSPPVREDPIISPISREPSQSLRDISISPPSRKTSRQPEHVSEPRYRPPRDLNEAMMMAGGRPPPSALKRSKAKRRSHHDDSPTKHRPLRASRHLDDEPQTPPPDDRRPSRVIDRSDSPSPTARHLTKNADCRTPSPVRETPIGISKICVSRGEEITVSFPARLSGQAGRSESRDPRGSYDEEETILQSEEPSTPKREASPEPEEKPLEELLVMKRRRPSALPALDLPTINKTRKADPVTPIPSPSRLSSEDAVLGSPLSDVSGDTSMISKESHEFRSPTGSEVGDIAPPPPPHSPNPIQLKGGKTPVLAHPSSAQQAGGRRRSSSPLKHEYEPSSASSSATSESEESEEYAAEEQDASSLSESSEEEELEDGDAPTPLLPMAALRALGKITSPHGSIYSLPNGGFGPTQATPQASAQKAAKTFKAIANIFSWSEKGAWEPLHLDECSIAVSPGLIEAFQMSKEHSRSASPSGAEPTGDSPRQPLVALELTPLVPLRRGTALDISIRSPPMAESKIKIGNNIMFRSRCPEDCEALYGAINTSRINNPKYIALQNAIPQSDGLNSFMDRRASGRGAGISWGWGLNRSSYRATGAAAPSIASSESSIGSFTSAFSALKRFGNGGRLFNISKSTISSRNGSRTGSITTSSSGASSSFGGNSPGATTPPALPSDDADPNKGSPIGLSNTKIRLYSRETASKWRDMGSARLTIMRPPPGPREPNPQNPHHHQQAEEKRILVMSKTAGAKPLLDVCLSESCFERVARTGIALSVWEEVVSKDGVVGGVPAEGGVGGKSRVYMIQMKTEAETAYTFSLVGKLRY